MQGSFSRILDRATRLATRIQESHSFLIAYDALQFQSLMGYEQNSDDLILRFANVSQAKQPPIVLVYKFILTVCRQKKLRHRGDAVYKQVYTASGLATRAWQPARDVEGHDYSTLELMVSRICTRLRNESIYELYIGVPTSALRAKLKTCVESEFPVLGLQRRALSHEHRQIHPF